MANEAIDPVGGTPPTQPTIPTIADKIPPGARSWIYAILPVGLLAVTFYDLPGAVEKLTLLANVAGFGVAFSNVPRRV